MRWLASLLGGQEAPRLVGIFIAREAGVPMQALDSVEAFAGRGLAGDRYAEDVGHWRLTDRCQITVISADQVARAERRSGRVLQTGAHRRNLAIAGLSQDELREARLRIGDVVLDWHRVRPPCGYLDQVAGRRMAKALGRHSGHCFRVITGGRLQVGDGVQLVRSPN